MKKSIISTITLAALSMGSLLPALADDHAEGGMIHNTVMLPVRAMGVGTGLAVGIPVATMKRICKNSFDKTQDVADNIGGKEHLPPTLFATIIGLPFGVVTGTMEGLYYGGKNAFESGVSKPFSQESMSMTDLD